LLHLSRRGTAMHFLRIARVYARYVLSALAAIAFIRIAN
jgi:hypothetical protein